MPLRILVKLFRIERKITQQALADGAGISLRFLQRIESGKERPSLETLEQIASFLRIPVGHLLIEDLPNE